MTGMVEIELVPLFTRHYQIGPFVFAFDVSVGMCGAGAVANGTNKPCGNMATHLVRQPVPSRTTGHESTRCVFGKVCREHLALNWPYGTVFIALKPHPGGEENWLEAWERVTMGLYGKVYSSMSPHAAAVWEKGQLDFHGRSPAQLGLDTSDVELVSLHAEVMEAAMGLGGPDSLIRVTVDDEEVQWTLMCRTASPQPISFTRIIPGGPYTVTQGMEFNVIYRRHSAMR